MPYCVITADIRKSREIADRGDLQETIFNMLQRVNETFARELLVPFSITLGDEWQGVLPSPAASYAIASYFVEQIYPHKIAVGIGEGGIDTGIRQRSAEMDGEAFHRSRAALTRAKELRSDILYVTTRPAHDLILNACCNLLQVIREDWTLTQFKKVRLYKQLGKETAVARELGVSQSDINQALNAAHARSYLDAEARINEFLRLEFEGSPQ